MRLKYISNFGNVTEKYLKYLKEIDLKYLNVYNFMSFN